MDEEPGGRLIEDDDESSLKIFLIADIRGYTRFTQNGGTRPPASWRPSSRR
jgi:hypothetical protein